MDLKRVLTSVVVLGAVACSGGGDGGGTTPTNEPPVIAFTFSPLATPHGVPVDLSITATDPDGDPLVTTWKVTRGTLTAQNSKKTVMRWATPAALGVDTVTVSVSDGTVTRKLVEEIHVGTDYAVGNFTKANSPYILTLSAANPRLPVTEGTTRTIEPGTEIFVSTSGTYFDVLGELDAHGTPDEHIIIRQNDRTFVCGSGANNGPWEGIRAGHAAAAPAPGVLDLEYVELWYARNGVHLSDDSVADLKNVTIRCSAVNGVLVDGSGYLRAIDSSITDGVGDGIALAAVVSLPDSVRIQGCTLSFNHGSGIRMDLNDTAMSTPIIVESNDIQFNEAHGISLAHAVFPQIHLNNFRGNGTETISSLFLQSGYPSVTYPELDATCNFWGSNATSCTITDVGIHDSQDQSTVHTRVKSCPWLPSNPLTTTPTCPATCTVCPTP
jgi:hypothetical protein